MCQIYICTKSSTSWSRSLWFFCCCYCFAYVPIDRISPCNPGYFQTVFLPVPSESWRWSNAPRCLFTYPPLAFVLFHLSQPWIDRAFSGWACHPLFGGQAPAADLLLAWNSPYGSDCPQTPDSLPTSASQMLELQARTMMPDSLLLLLLFKWSSAFHGFTQIHKLFASSPKYSHFPLIIQRMQFKILSWIIDLSASPATNLSRSSHPASVHFPRAVGVRFPL